MSYIAYVGLDTASLDLQIIGIRHPSDQALDGI